MKPLYKQLFNKYLNLRQKIRQRTPKELYDVDAWDNKIIYIYEETNRNDVKSPNSYAHPAQI